MKYIELKNGKKWNLNEAYNGDCLDFMRLLPDKCIDLVLTDPPYGINMDGGNVGYKGFNDFEKKDWDKSAPEQDIFDEMFRVSKHQIIFGGNYFNLPPSRCWLIWDKGAGFKNRTFAEAELAWTSMDENVRIFKHDPLARGDYRGKQHPTQKPLKLFKWCLEKHAPKNAIVFDPFLGSFTTAVACHSHGLNWIGAEKDPDYFKAGMERYETECLQNLMDFGS